MAGSRPSYRSNGVFFWVFTDRLREDLPKVAAHEFTHIRTTRIENRPDLDAERLTLCRELGIRYLYLAHDDLTEEQAQAYPLLGADGRHYPRGHMGITNIYHPEVQAASQRNIREEARFAAENADVVAYLQLMNEWLLRTYIIGWRRDLGLATLGFPPVLVSYDQYAAQAWQDFLCTLPDTWKAKILAECGVDSLDAVPMLRDYRVYENKNFSPIYLAWAKFRSYSLGRYFSLLYEAAKQEAPDVQIASHACMPHIVGAMGVGRSDLGHDVEWWLEAGRCCDQLCVNTYQNYWGIVEKPYLHDNDLEFLLYYTAFAEVVRAYHLDGLLISEVGGSSFNHSEDAHRYTVARSILQATAFGQPEALTEFCWGDDVQRTPIHEHFFGIAREKGRAPKPAFFSYELARDISNRTPAFADPPYVLLILSRMVMDMGQVGLPTIPPGDNKGDEAISELTAVTLEPSALFSVNMRLLPAPLAARDTNWRVTTDHILGRYGPGEAAHAIVISDSGAIAERALIEQLLAFRGPVVIPASLGRQGVDDDALRSERVLELIGLGEVPFMPVATLSFSITEAWDGMPVGRSYQIPYCRDVAHLQAEGLPEGAKVLARFADGTVAVYRYHNRIVLAFGLDGPWPEWMSPFAMALGRAIGEEAGALRCVTSLDADSRLLIYPMGDMVAVVNSRLAPVMANLSGPQGHVSLPVGGQEVGAYRLEEGKLTYAVITAEGSVAVGGVELIHLPAGLLLHYDEGAVRIRPYYHPNGRQITRLMLNGVSLDPVADDLSPYWEADDVKLPLHVEVETVERVHAVADFLQKITLTTGDTDGAQQQVSFLPEVDLLELVYETADDVMALRLSIYSCTDEAAWQPVWVRTFDGTVGELRRVSLDVPAEPLTVWMVRLDLLGSAGAKVSSWARAELQVTYRQRPIPSLNHPDRGLVTVRLLYPYAYEHCSITALDVQVHTDGEWQPLEVYVGENGQHINRLYRSEFTTHVLP